MNNIFIGNLTIPITNWILKESRPNIDSDIFIWNKIKQQIEFYNYSPTFDAHFQEQSYLDKTKVFLIPQSIQKAKLEYANYANLESFTYNIQDNDLVVNLDQWAIKEIKMPLYQVFEEASELVDGDNIDYIRMKNILMSFIGEIQFQSSNKIVLPTPDLKSDGTIDSDATYSPFLTLALSSEILIKFIKWKTQDIDELNTVLMFKTEWHDILNKIISFPDKFVKEDYINHSLKKRKILSAVKKELRGINF